MLSGLKIKAKIEARNQVGQTFIWTYNANTLLSYMQQVWPGVETAMGNGSKAMPYKPKTAKQWFFCAKVKGAGRNAKRFPNLTANPSDHTPMAWFKVGGRFIGIDPESFYASDFGTNGSALALDAPTYPNLKKAVETWKGLRGGNTDSLLTKMMRDLMAGKTVMRAPDVLPVLTVVLFISEVARNHTAFHTNLMAMDLIQAGLSLPTSTGSVDWNWPNAVWLVDACQACAATGSVPCSACGGSGSSGVRCRSCGGSGEYKPAIMCRSCGGGGCRRCHGTGIFKPALQCRACSGYGTDECNTCGGRGTLRCGQCRGRCRGTVYDEFRPKGVTKGAGKTIFTGGGQALQNGLLPMSHKGSAFGSAFDLTGAGAYKLVGRSRTINASEAPSELMVVRRKEASVLIQWLQKALDDSEIRFSETQTLKIRTKVDKTDLSLKKSDFTHAYKEITNRALAGRTLDDDTGDGDLESEVKDTVRANIVKYLQLRAEELWFAFDK